jgi:hypothetical protein
MQRQSISSSQNQNHKSQDILSKFLLFSLTFHRVSLPVACTHKMCLLLFELWRIEGVLFWGGHRVSQDWSY